MVRGSKIVRRLGTKGPGVSQPETQRRPTLAGRYRGRDSYGALLVRTARHGMVSPILPAAFLHFLAVRLPGHQLP